MYFLLLSETCRHQARIYLVVRPLDGLIVFFCLSSMNSLYLQAFVRIDRNSYIGLLGVALFFPVTNVEVLEMVFSDYAPVISDISTPCCLDKKCAPVHVSLQALISEIMSLLFLPHCTGSLFRGELRLRFNCLFLRPHMGRPILHCWSFEILFPVEVFRPVLFYTA